MNTNDVPMKEFLKGLMKRRKLRPFHLASALNVSHSTVSRWLSGHEKPNIDSCRKLAEFSGMHINKILVYAYYLPKFKAGIPEEWPEFREYAQIKYRNELDEELITLIEDLIERKRDKRNGRKTPERCFNVASNKFIV